MEINKILGTDLNKDDYHNIINKTWSEYQMNLYMFHLTEVTSKHKMI